MPQEQQYLTQARFSDTQASQNLLPCPWKENLESRVLELLENQEAVVLVTIVQSEGSAPRHAGTRALQTNKGFEGTVGGGALEAKAMQCARSCLAEHSSCAAHFSLEAKATSDMICGGQMRIVCEWLDQKHKDDFMRAHKALQLGQKGFWLLLCPQRAGDEFADHLECRRHLILSPQDQPKDLPESISAALAAAWNGTDGKPSFLACDDLFAYLEPLEPSPTLLLLGGGHVALEVAKLAFACGFVVDVVDDRESFANPQRFPMARRCLALPAFSGLCDHLEIGAGHYVAIMTRGHAFDQTCLEQVLTSKARYLGMIGSRKKKAQILEALQKKGFAEERLQSVFCPIGLPLKAESPQQIAVSIVAELLAVKGSVSPWCSALCKA